MRFFGNFCNVYVLFFIRELYLLLTVVRYFWVSGDVSAADNVVGLSGRLWVNRMC